jgi:hypothetical protein
VIIIIPGNGHGLTVLNYFISLHPGLVTGGLGTEAAIFRAVTTASIDNGAEMKLVPHEMTADLIGDSPQGLVIRAEDQLPGGFPINGFTVYQSVVGFLDKLGHGIKKL